MITENAVRLRGQIVEVVEVDEGGKREEHGEAIDHLKLN